MERMQQQQQPHQFLFFCPFGSQLPTVNSNKRKDADKEIQCEDEESEVSSVLTLSCDYPSNNKKARSSESSSVADKPNLVSTELTLFDTSWTTTIKDPVSDNLARMREEFEREKHREKVSTELTLYGDPCKKIRKYPGIIKKILKESDLGSLCRLLISTALIKNHILPFLSNDVAEEVNSNHGATVILWDIDTATEHKLTLKKWISCGSFVFNDGWTQNFVKRRNLKKGDEIGIVWDIASSRFNFTVIRRAL
ncbi:B3 domain-containing protein At2g33720 [Ricinus communis]|uniref:Transcription factor, putative n=1 Tax=Ricinus communis TaxID=3988 RepID=B9T311_RICCO|nr:B3 domain-containing protein At2g33720 [Ricinus communis]EEF29761.1 transcription factor, putative [Ricinus communis]|eukprot:XP_025015487.1 B3 domain-containing protein At2g33720-like [Ricinus communis]